MVELKREPVEISYWPGTSRFKDAHALSGLINATQSIFRSSSIVNRSFRLKQEDFHSYKRLCRGGAPVRNRDPRLSVTQLTRSPLDKWRRPLRGRRIRSEGDSTAIQI